MQHSTHLKAAHLKALSWRIPLAALGGLGVAVLLVLASLQLALPHLRITPSTSPAGAFGIGVAPFALFGLATVVGVLMGASVVAVLARDACSGWPVRLPQAWGDAWRALPRLTVLTPVLMAALFISVRWWQYVDLAALLLLLVGLAAPATRPLARRHLWLAVPFAPALALVVLGAVVTASVLGRHAVLGAVRDAWSTSWPARARVAGSLLALAVTAWALGALGASVQASSLPTGTVIGFLLAFTALLEAAVGLTLAVVGLIAGSPLLPRPSYGVGVEARRARRAPHFWDRRRLASTAVLTVLSIALQSFSFSGMAFAANAADGADSPSASVDEPVDEPVDEEPGTNPLLVNTLDDSLTYPATDCSTRSAPCGVRAALATAYDRLAGSDGSVSVRFDLEGTVLLAGVLELHDGVNLYAAGHDVVLDAQHSGRALHAAASTPAAWGTQLSGITVVGGRSVGPGAGLLADDGVRVTLNQVVFRDNVSGTDGVTTGTDGGAVASSGQVDVNQSTFADNRARSGRGGAVAAGELAWSNSTSVRDTGTGATGGALFSTGTAYVQHATVVGGGGVAGSGDPVELTNSIVDVPDDGPAVACDNVAKGQPTGNLDPTGSCHGTTGHLTRATAPGDLSSSNRPTPTIRLFEGSNAIGLGEQALCGYADQLDTLRPYGERCDAGAFQSDFTAPVVLEMSLSSRTNPAQHSDPVVVDVRVTSTATVPAGSVRVLDGTRVVGTAETLDASGRAAITLRDLSPGRRQLVAEYVLTDGDSAASSRPLEQVVSVETSLEITAPGPVRLHDRVTVTATLHSPAGSDPADATGTITFTTFDAKGNPVQETQPIAGGAAQLEIASLEAASVEASYSGDELFGFTLQSQQITTEDLATTTTGTVLKAEAGAPLVVQADVVDAVGPVRFATVRLLEDGELLTDAFVFNGRGTLQAPALALGAHTLTIETHPTTGWADSSTTIVAHVVASGTSVTIDPVQPITYGQDVEVFARFTGVGRSDVRLLDGDTVLQTKTLDLPGYTAFSAPLDVGSHVLTVDVVGSASTAPSRSAPVTVVVPKVPVTLSVGLGTIAELGGESTLVVAGSNEGNGRLRVIETAGGTTIGSGTLADGAGLVTFTPLVAGETTLRIELDPDRRYEAASVTTTVAVARTTPPRPDLTWNDTPTVGDATLQVRFDGALTGTVLLVDEETRTTVGTARLVEGAAAIAFTGQAGICFCADRLILEYAGDERWAPRTYGAVPDVRLPLQVTTTTLAQLPAVIAFDDPLTLTASVASTTDPDPQGTVVFSVDGTEQSAVDVVSGVAQLPLGRQQPGRYDLGARFVPGAGTGLAASAAATASVTVAHPTAPEVVLTTPDAPVVGTPLTVTVTAGHPLASSAVRPGSLVSLVDAAGEVLATGTWPTNDARSLDIELTPRHAGALLLQARFDYGPTVQPGVSQVLTLTVAPRPTPLRLTSRTSSPQLGQVMTLRVGLDELPADLRSSPLEVTVTDPTGQALATGVIGLEDDHVDLELVPAVADYVTYRVTTGGDGADLGAGSAEARVYVWRADTTLTLVAGDPVNVFRPWRPDVRVQADTAHPSLPAPTGSLTMSISGRTLTCDLSELGTAACEFPAGSLQPPSAYVSLLYSGDAHHAMSIGTGSVPTVRPYTEITAAFGPDPDQWVVGEDVTATWQVTGSPSGTSTAGTVTVSIGNGRTVLCTADAGLGTCTFPAPDRGTINPYYTGQDEVLVTTFVPRTDDVAGSEAWRHVPRPPHCLPVSSLGTEYAATNGLQPPSATPPTLSGTPCNVSGQPGFVEGQPLTADFSAALKDPALANYRMDHWEAARKGTGDASARAAASARADAGATFTMPASAGLVLRAVLKWAPVCVTVRLGTERDAPGFDAASQAAIFGSMRALTTPTCEDPRGGVWDYHLLSQGKARYAVGTPVQLEISPDDRHRVLDVVGATVSNPTFMPGVRVTASLTATKDSLVYPRYRDVHACTAVETGAGPGGRLTVVSGSIATRVQQTQMSRFYGAFEDPSGACRTATGAAGFLAATSLTLKVTPSNDGTAQPPPHADQYFFLGRWHNAFPGDAATLLAPTIQGTRPAASAYQPATQVVTVPAPEKAGGRPVRYGASFAHISCAPVALVLDHPVQRGSDPRLRLSEASACPARPDTNISSTAPVVESAEPASTNTLERRTDSRVAWALVGTKAEVRADPQVLGVPYGQRHAVFTTRDQRGPLAGTTPSDSSGQLGTVRAGAQYVVSAHYTSNTCVTPDVTVRPASFGYRVVSTSCPPGMVDPTNWARARLVANPKPGLVPVWSVAGGRHGVYDPNASYHPLVTYLVSAQAHYYLYGGTNELVPKVTLSYCAPLPVSSALVAHGGRAPLGSYTTYGSGSDPLARVTRGAPPASGLVADDDPGCPGLSAAANTSPSLSLSSAGQQLFRLEGTRSQGSTGAFTGTLGRVTVGPQGQVPNAPEVGVSLHCFGLNTGKRVDVALPANCPSANGGTSGFTKGTVVPVSFDGSSKVEFNHWNGVDSPKPSEEQGHDAVVVMDGQRDVSADYDSLSVWEQMGNWFSNLGQRIVGAFVSMALGLLTGAYAVVQFTALVSQGISAGLSAVGVPSSVTSVFDNYSATVDNIGTVVNSLGDCTSSWASGGRSSVLALPGNGTAGAVLNGVNNHGGTVLEIVGANKASEHMGTASTVLGAATMLTTGINDWTQAPSWSAAGDIGSCLKTTIGDAADRQAGMFGVTTGRP
ncbi:Ig-like domain-containing protein [Nocardioides sp. 616]|uniref:Ig-like domain-containing protein n=1 Tax=Nocardioides sp. 616 TaxID=2268090 RepID=UPI0013B43611|nr:Ig-like domain-containing protein [Nocardioides sp. 616]